MVVTWNQQIARQVESLLAAFPELRLAYLFGSQVEGQTGPLSDYDFGVLIDDIQAAPAVRARLAHELGRILGTCDVDVVILNRAPIELAYAIIAQGKLVYERDRATRVEYEAGVLSLYGDYLPVLRAQLSDIRGGGEHAARVQRYREALRRTERTLGEIRAAQGEGPR